MNKRKGVFIILAIIAMVVLLYVSLRTLYVRSEINQYLTGRGDTASEVGKVSVKHSFMNLLLSYNAWNIDVKYYDEPDVTYHYTYKDNEIIFSGVSGGTKDKDEYNHMERQFKGTIIEAYSGTFIVQPNENEEIRKTSDKISITGSLDETWEIGTKVIVKYTGAILETYPAQVNTISIQEYKE